MRRAAFFDVDGTVVASDIVRYGVEIRTMDRSRLGRLGWISGFLPRVPWLLALDAWRREAFQRSFYRVYSGLEAAEVTLHESFDVIITDMKMPGLDGASFYRQVRERDPEQARRIARQRIDGGVCAGSVRMAAHDVHFQLQGHVSLLGDADQRHGTVGHGRIAQRQPTLVEHECRLDPAAREQLRRFAGTAASRFLIVSEHEDHAACRPVPGGDQGLRRFDEGDE